MTKVFVLLLAVLMVCSLAACAAKQDAPAGSAAPEGSAAQEAAGPDDGQNPAMNFIGTYGKDRATIFVETDGQENAKITVSWAGSAFENAEWVMTGKLDGETLKLDYSDCVKRVLVFKEDGSVESETVEYENGTGTITFQVDDSGATTLLWDDAQEHIADGAEFEYCGIGG